MMIMGQISEFHVIEGGGGGGVLISIDETW